MNAGLIETRRMSATELVLRSSVAAATPSQQQLRRSSTLYTPSTWICSQIYTLREIGFEVI